MDADIALMNLEIPTPIASPLPNVGLPTTCGRRVDVLCVIGSGFGKRRFGLVGEGSA